jgi:hypothetical protein
MANYSKQKQENNMAKQAIVDTRDIAKMEHCIKSAIDTMMTELYKTGGNLGYDSTETRLMTCQIFSSRSTEIAIADHRHKVDPSRQINRLIKALEGKAKDLNFDNLPME